MVLAHEDHILVGNGARNPLDDELKVEITAECPTPPFARAHPHALVGCVVGCLDPSQKFPQLPLYQIGLVLVVFPIRGLEVDGVHCDDDGLEGPLQVHLL